MVEAELHCKHGSAVCEWGSAILQLGLL